MLLVLGIEALLGVALSLVRRPSATEKQARVEIRAKKIELRRKRDPSLFVEASKLERRIIALEKSLAASKASREAKLRCGTTQRCGWNDYYGCSRCCGARMNLCCASVVQRHGAE